MKNKYWVAGILICAIAAGGVFAAKKFRPGPGGPKASADAKLRGNPAAPVEIIEYSDFQCPACARTQFFLEGYMKSYPGQVKIIYRHFPLPMHRWAALAHQAAECANKDGKFWEYHDLLYKEQKAWSESLNPMESFFRYAGSLQMSLDGFAACLSDKSVFEKILKERKSGEELQITSTPTLFINGERVVGPFEVAARGENAVRRALGLPENPVPTSIVDPQTGETVQLPSSVTGIPPAPGQPPVQTGAVPPSAGAGAPAPGHEGHNH